MNQVIVVYKDHCSNCS